MEPTRASCHTSSNVCIECVLVDIYYKYGTQFESFLCIIIVFALMLADCITFLECIHDDITEALQQLHLDQCGYAVEGPMSRQEWAALAMRLVVKGIHIAGNDFNDKSFQSRKCVQIPLTS
jgi:hypothetical protein